MSQRIQKVLAQAGVDSRRAIERRIVAGSVRLNGAPAEPGSAVEQGDRVQVDGRRYRVIEAGSRPPRWLRYHKPEGQVSTRSDPDGRPTVFESLPRLPGGRWVSLGRLDVNTSGLMLFTDDGEWAHALTHPSREVEREYAVRVRGRPDDDMLARLTQGVPLDDGEARFDRVIDVGGEGSNHWYHVVLHEGRRNEVRRLWQALGCQVARLVRVRFGPIELPRRLRQGRFEDLSSAEVAALRQQAGFASTQDRDHPRGLTLEPESGRAAGSSRKKRGKQAARAKRTRVGAPNSMGSSQSTQNTRKRARSGADKKQR